MRLRGLLSHTEEGKCREGAEACVRRNDAAVAGLLLEVLRLDQDRGGYLPSAHYRDVVWGALGELTDAAARKLVEEELQRNKKNPWVRQWCAELLGEYGDGVSGPTLLKALADKELGVKRAAARSLGKVRCAEAAKALLADVDHRDPVLRANAIEALARIDALGQGEPLHRGLADEDGGVRCALLAAAVEIFPLEAEALATAALGDPDWRPRMQAVDSLGQIQTKSAVDALIGALGDARPAVAERAVQRLQELTGAKHSRREAWEQWWRENRESFAFPAGLQQAAPDEERTRATYHGIRMVSDHVAFLIDKSQDMGATLKSRSCTKDQAARDELAAVLAQLRAGLTFNVFTYADDVRPFEEKGPVALTPRTQEKALGFVQGVRLLGSKDIWQALELVLADPDVDTAYLLSSGEPEIGTYVHWNRVTWHLRDLNRFHKLVVHAIAYTDSDWYRQQLEKIAEATGGEFRSFE